MERMDPRGLWRPAVTAGPAAAGRAGRNTLADWEVRAFRRRQRLFLVIAAAAIALEGIAWLGSVLVWRLAGHMVVAPSWVALVLVRLDWAGVLLAPCVVALYAAADALHICRRGFWEEYVLTSPPAEGLVVAAAAPAVRLGGLLLLLIGGWAALLDRLLWEPQLPLTVTFTAATLPALAGAAIAGAYAGFCSAGAPGAATRAGMLGFLVQATAVVGAGVTVGIVGVVDWEGRFRDIAIPLYGACQAAIALAVAGLVTRPLAAAASYDALTAARQAGRSASDGAE